MFLIIPNIFLYTADERETSGRCYKNFLKRVFNKRNITSFKQQLSLLHWRCIDFNMELWMKFMTCFWEHWLTSMMLVSPYGSIFLKLMTSYPVDQQRSKEILKKKKKRLYIKFLKTKTLEHEYKYKTYKSLFEKLSKKS